MSLGLGELLSQGKGNRMVEVTDKGGQLCISEQWRLSGHMKGEGTVYYPHPLTSCLETKMYLREKVETPPKRGYKYVLMGTILCLMQLCDPVGE